MSRASIRMKQYRPVSADFTKVGSGLSAVFGLNQETNDDKTSSGSNGVLLINYRRSSGNSPSHSPNLSDKNLIDNDVRVNEESNIAVNKDKSKNKSPKSRNERNCKSSPKAVSTLVSNNKNIERKLNLVAPIAVTEELEADDCETESETNEDRTTPTPGKDETTNNGSNNASVTQCENEASSPVSKSCTPQALFSSTPAKLENSSGKKSHPKRSQVSKSMDGDDSWWSEDDIDVSGSATASTHNSSHNTKSLSLPARNLGLQNYEDEIGGSPSSQSNVKVDSYSANQLSSSVRSCDNASEFESFSCTDDDDDDCDESDQDSTSIESSSLNQRSQDDSKSRFKPKFLRAKFRDSKTWGKKSISNSEEKEQSSSTNGIPSDTSNGYFQSTCQGNSSKPSTVGSSNGSSVSIASSFTSNQDVPESRLSRLFSLRRSVGPGAASLESKASMPRVAEEEEQMLGGQQQPTTGMARQQPPSLPLAPAGLGLEQLKRRHIVASLVHSENNYVASLQRLVNDYKKPLEESSPPILNSTKVALLFHRVPEILHYHTLFRIALSEAIANWDRDEAIGDVFVATFSKAVVLEIYSEFINNFTTAMECARQESKRKSAFADFLKVKQITAQDRVSFFGLMVKPVQRFPQFILLLQDLLKETPQGHTDRMALQLALTTLESLAEMLNERKREAEQYAAFRDKMRSISSGKFGSGTRSALMSSSATISTINSLNSSNCNHIGESGPSSLGHSTLDRTSSGGYSGSGPNSLNSLSGSYSQPAGPPLRFLLREDNVTQLEFNSSGMVSRSKQRRLLLLNDLLVCVSVAGRSSEVDFPSTVSAAANERLTLKWAVPVGDVELIDGTAGGTLARLLSAGSVSSHGSTHGDHALPNYGGGRKRTSLTRSLTPSSFTIGGSTGHTINSSSNHTGGNNMSSSHGGHETGNGQQGEAENLAQDMNDLMHDFDVVSRISSMIGTLRGDYEDLNTKLTAKILSDIQRSIRQKDEEMSWADASCLQFVIRGRGSKDKPESYTFQCRDPNIKKEWIVELRLAQLALDPSNSPGWDVLEQERSVSTKMPLFVKSYNAFYAKARQSEVTCGASYTLLIPTATRTLRPQTFVWVNAHDGINSHLRIFNVTAQHTGLKELGTICLPDTTTINGGIKCIQYVPGLHGGIPAADPEPLRGDLVWVGTDSKKLILYSANDPERGTQLGMAALPADVMCIAYHCDAVWVGLASGALAVFRRNIYSLSWDIACPQLVSLGTDAIMSLLPVHSAKELPGIYAACGKRVWVIDAFSNEQLRSFVVQPRNSNVSERSNVSLAMSEKTNDLKLGDANHVHQMAQSGVGLWISLRNSSTICLYHTETFRHLQDINIASNVSRVLAARDVCQPQRSIHVTSLMASRGLLWVGTNVGIALTVPLPRLEGVPIISGRANISYHAHYGPVTFFLNIQHKIVSAELPSIYQAHENNDDNVCTNLHSLNSSTATNDLTMMIREESEQDLRSEKDDEESCSSLTQISHSNREGTCETGETNTDSIIEANRMAVKSNDHQDNRGPQNDSLDTNTSSSNSSTPPPLPTTEPPKNSDGFSHEDENLSSLNRENAGSARGSTKLRHRNSSPPLRVSRARQRFTQDIPPNRRFSKTLPRGFSLANQMGADPLSDFTSDVYGLYGELFNVRDYDYCDGSGDFGRHEGTIGQMAESDENRKSDPEISTIPYRVSTLDRRMRMKSSRPRSLDMSSTWSVESRGSISSGGHSTTTSSSEAGSERPSPNVSRNASFQSNGQPMTTSPLATNCSSQGINTHATINKAEAINSVTSSSSTISNLSVNSKLTYVGRQMHPTPPLPAQTPKADIPKLDAPKTVITLMGGRGYINWRRVAVEKQRTSALAQINNYDAFLVIWEMKL